VRSEQDAGAVRFADTLQEVSMLLAPALLLALATPTPPRQTPTPGAAPMLSRGAPASAPSTGGATRTLTDVARERRGQPRTAGSFSASDSTAPELEPAGAPPGVAAPPRAPQAGDDEQAWRRKAANARDGVRRAETELKRAQDALNSGTFITQGNYLTPGAQKEMDRRRAALDSAKARLARAEKAVSDLDEEARHAGVPPGWLR
jgi:hypothetical protein